MVVLVLVLGMVALGAVDPEARHVVPELDREGGGRRGFGLASQPGDHWFPLTFLDFPCFSIGSARGPEVREPMDFHQISGIIPRKMLEGTNKVHKTTSK